MQAARDVRPDNLRQPRLDVAVDVLQVVAQFELARLDLRLHLAERADQGLRVGGGDDALRGEHAACAREPSMSWR